MNRRDFQELARLRMRDAETLIRTCRYSAAYYLSGYVVECALKACIAKKTKRYDFPDKRAIQDIYTHNLEQLVKAAGLEDERKRGSTSFQTNWAIVKDWSEHSRYDRVSHQKAQDMYDAIADMSEGVLAWVERFW